MSRTGPSPKRLDNACAHHGQQLAERVLRFGCINEVEVRALRRRQLRYHPSLMRCALVMIRLVAAFRNASVNWITRAGGNDVRQHLNRSHTRQLVDITH